MGPRDRLLYLASGRKKIITTGKSGWLAGWLTSRPSANLGAANWLSLCTFLSLFVCFFLALALLRSLARSSHKFSSSQVEIGTTLLVYDLIISCESGAHSLIPFHLALLSSGILISGARKRVRGFASAGRKLEIRYLHGAHVEHISLLVQVEGAVVELSACELVVGAR